MMQPTVLYVIDRHDWALGVVAREMRDSLAEGWRGEILAADEIVTNPLRAWRASRRASVVHFLAPYMAVAFPWIAVGRHHVVSLTNLTTVYPDLVRLRFSRFMGISEITAQEARDWGLRVEHVCRHGGTAPLTALGRERLDGPLPRDGLLTVGFIAKLSSDSFGSKGLDILVDVARRLSERIQFRLLICGEGWDGLVADLRAANVHVENIGFIPHAEIDSFYRQLDVLVVTSRVDGAPTVLAEGVAAGLPAVTTRVGLAPEIVEPGESGYICPVEGTECLVEHLHDILADPAALDRMTRRAARIGIDGWSWTHDRDRVQAMYPDVLHRDRPYRGAPGVLRQAGVMLYATARHHVGRVIGR